MWQNGYLIIVFAILDSHCLDFISKAGFTSENSNLSRYLGRFIIGGGTKLTLNKDEESNTTAPNNGPKHSEGFQSDQPASTVAWGQLVVSKLRQLNPTVYCGGDSMTLRVQGKNMPNFMVDCDDGQVQLTQMNENCGLLLTKVSPYSSFTIRYDGCCVTHQGDDHVLPLHLWGIPINMSCPVAVSTSSILCLSSGMVSKIGCSSANGLKLKVNGKWNPFIPASRTCGITTASETDGMVITAPYQSSCWQIKGNEKFLSILYGEEELVLSCPDSQDSYPHGHVDIISDLSPDLISTTIGPASNPEQPQAVTIGPTTTVLTLASTSDIKDIPYYSMGLKPYPKPYGYPWALSPKVPTTTTAQTAATSSTVARNPEQPQHPLPPVYYPYGPTYHHKPRPFGYPWAFPPKMPTTAPTATSAETNVTSATVASNPQQYHYPLPPVYYPYGPMYHHKPRPFGYPWAFPPKMPTTAPTATSAETNVTSATVASNPQQPHSPLPPVYYPYGPMYHHKPRPYGYPLAFPPKMPTTAPTATTSQTSLTSVASDPEQPQGPLYYPYGPMLYHHKPRPYGYPWVFPPKVPTTPTKQSLTNMPTTSLTATKLDAMDPYQSISPINHMYFPFGPMHCHHGHLGYPLAFPAKVFTAPNKFALTKPPTASTPTSTATTPNIASNPKQPPYFFNPYQLSHILHHPRPMPFDYPWGFPTKASVTDQKRSVTTSPTNCDKDRGH